MHTFDFTIVTPERELLHTQVSRVTLPTAEGEITVLANHEPLVAVLVPGEMRVASGGEEHAFAVSRGFIEVRQKAVHVLADTAERSDEIDEERAIEAKRRAEELMQQTLDEEKLAETTAILERNLVRLHVVRKHKTRHMPKID